MEVGGNLVPANINPGIFPAKLWRLVNNPAYKAISWDSLGEIIVIDQPLFEQQILSPKPMASDDDDGFKTTNFCSFIRQLNLYGFKKVLPVIPVKSDPAITTYHHFHNQYFIRSRPDLLTKLKRLTVENKAKLKAGLEVASRPPNKYDAIAMGDGVSVGNMKRGSLGLPLLSHQRSPHPYISKNVAVPPGLTGTPVPSRFLIKGHGGAFCPVYPAGNKMPAYLKQFRLAQDPSAMHLQHGLMAAYRGPVISSFCPNNLQFQSGYIPPVCQCCCQHHSDLQDRLFTPSYYHTGYPLSVGCHMDSNQVLQSVGSQEDMMRSDVDLDTVFQIAEEVMRTPLYNCVVKVETPEKTASPAETTSSAWEATRWGNSYSSMVAHPLPDGPAVGTRSSFPPLPGEKGECVVSQPQQVCKDTKPQVTNQDRRATVIKCCNVRQTSQK